MKLNLITILTLLLVSIFAVSCGGYPDAGEMDVDSLLTAAVGTMAASFFETQTAMVTPETVTTTLTMTPLPTFTPYPAVTPQSATPTFIFYIATLGTLTPATPTASGTLPTATVNPNVLAYGCNNLAFVRDVTMPAGTALQKNQDFTKTWKVQNTGTCNWMYQYRLTLLSGDGLGASSDAIQKQVAVWSWAEVSVRGTTPKKPGTYTSYWRMMDGGGHMFGSTLVLSFVVVEPTAVPSTNTPQPPFTNTPEPTSTFTETALPEP
ncbi:MAG: NBR1-Ig-like domain-containing protein [Anaerolineales bacterium]|nr:MAG: NBR1-Ig-like domain-containing protein [Anaerolineales bacterium]